MDWSEISGVENGCFLGGGEIDCSWENLYLLWYPGEELTYASGEEDVCVIQALHAFSLSAR